MEKNTNSVLSALLKRSHIPQKRCFLCPPRCRRLNLRWWLSDLCSTKTQTRFLHYYDNEQIHCYGIVVCSFCAVSFSRAVCVHLGWFNLLRFNVVFVLLFLTIFGLLLCFVFSFLSSPDNPKHFVQATEPSLGNGPCLQMSDIFAPDSL